MLFCYAICARRCGFYFSVVEEFISYQRITYGENNDGKKDNNDQ